jgi:hypothetical protein
VSGIQSHYPWKVRSNDDFTSLIITVPLHQPNKNPGYTEPITIEIKKVKVKVKQSRYKPGVAQRVPGS